MDTKVTEQEAFEKLDQMIEYRNQQLTNPDKSKFVKGLIQKEIDVLEFISTHAKSHLDSLKTQKNG